jgi:hypothetical protein
MRLIAGLCGALVAVFATDASAQVAILQGLDKVTARVSTIEAPLDRTVRFGTLSIVVHYCSKKPPEEEPETRVFLEIKESRPGEVPIPLFNGWMFGSSPAISALEHPVYDIWVIDCKTS